MSTANPLVRARRPLIMGARGAVAGSNPLAAEAGLAVLRQGGGAVDAAVAVSTTLAVVQPHMSGLGGDGFFHVHHAATGRSVVYNGTGAAARSATADLYLSRHGGVPVSGPASVSTPGLVAGLGLMHAAHGTKPWASLLERATEYARVGFASTAAYRRFTTENHAKLSADARSRTTLLGRDARPAALGELILQPDLARTLDLLASEGPESFYRGRIAERLAAGLREAGAPVGAADLADCRGETVPPIRIDYRGFEVRQTPPNSMGFTLLQELRIVERFDLATMGWGSADLVHVLVEAKKRAFLDRERHAADPRWSEAPLDRLLSAEHAARHAAAIDLRSAARLPVTLERGGGDTTYFCVVDHAGNAVSAIQSLNSAFGSGVTAGDTGVLMNNRMAYWHLEPGHPNRLAPGKRVRHTMNAPMVLRDGRLWCVFGTPGADKQVQINLQALVGMVDFGLDPQTVLEQPRWNSNQPGDEANYPHTSEDSLTLERGFGASVIDELARRGHIVKPIDDLAGPCSVEIIRILDNGVRMAGSDPRLDGWAAAY